MEMPWVAVFMHFDEPSWNCYPVPLPLGSISCKRCCSWAFLHCMLVALPEETVRALAVSSNEMQLPSLIMVFTCAASLLFLLFFTVPILLKMLDFPDWKYFAHWKTVAFEGADDRIASQREFLLRTVRKWHVPWCRTESTVVERVRFPSFFFRQCLLHGSQKMLWNKLPCSFLCVCAFLHTNTSDCSFWLCHLLFCASSFAMNLRGVLSKIEIPLYCSWLV